MPLVDLIDETFIVCRPEAIAEVVHDQTRWSHWWPDLTLTVFMDRGDKGVRWSAVGDPVGSVEIWLEPMGDGVLVHHYVRLDPVGADPHDARTVRRGVRDRARRARAWKVHVWALKDELEGARRPGDPADPPAPPTASGSSI